MDPYRSGERRLREELSAALETALQPVRSEVGPLGILFSGGVDSSLLAWELRGLPDVTLFTVGTDRSTDLRAGGDGALRLQLPWRGLRVGPEDVHRAEERFGSELTGLPTVSRTVLLALALAIEASASARLVCGQGVDEIFLGYAHYRGLAAAEAEERSRADLERLHATDWPRTQRIADRCGKRIRAPYLAPEFEAVAQRIPVELRLPGNDPKRFFRQWAVERGLPREIADRRKKAMQYGSGVDALLKTTRRSAR